MASGNAEILNDFPPFFKVYKDGRIERYMVMDPVPPGTDPKTGIHTKDVAVSSDVSARIFLPKIDEPDQKLPVLVHYHGGGFCVGSAFDVVSHKLLTYLATQAHVLAISVDYRLAPENPLPIAYDDSWAALQWIAAHSDGRGPEPWLNEHADLGRVFLMGESAGANIAHSVAVRAGVEGLGGAKIIGALMVHPFFGGKEPDKMYQILCPTSSGGEEDPRLNPGADPNLGRMGCERVKVYVAEKDGLIERGVGYCETVGKSAWRGRVELVETKGQDHCFHLFNPHSHPDVATLLASLVDFISHPHPHPQG
ncbi:2-hydroxyisoflavanone dehydratase-like [Malania oleifera]|uniref:2-hydroxyisoflavanone dehydratase-like n=1 Tax=Malania oleifera TaxID=397392 RepID=UPI0025AECDC6|nr:2-hydroxyisoflavanone dehydratase-like [Malania oleifera]